MDSEERPAPVASPEPAQCAHFFEVVVGETAFLRYCKMCGSAHILRNDGIKYAFTKWEKVKESEI